MHFDFATALVLAALVTGAVWVLDAAVLAGRRESFTGEGQTASVPWYVEYSRSFFPVIVAVLLLRSFIVEPFRIPSGSMMPTLLAGDFILVNKFSYGLRLPVLNSKFLGNGSPERGDVVVFRYPEDPSVAYIKRVVGLPGDRLSYVDKVLYVNEEPAVQTDQASEEWAREGLQLRDEALGDAQHQILVSNYSPAWEWEKTVPPGQYFVLGDNRDNSRDSRFWGFLPDENLIGKAFIIWMNWDCVTGQGHCNRIGDRINEASGP
jgi:signal peptidase I